jgi:hypothetical protein
MSTNPMNIYSPVMGGTALDESALPSTLPTLPTLLDAQGI